MFFYAVQFLAVAEDGFTASAFRTMREVGRTLFGGGRFVRWAISPFVVFLAIIMPLAIDDWTPARVVLMGALELMCVCLLAGFWLPARVGKWAFRVLAGMVFLLYAGYVVDEFFFSKKPFTFSGRRSDASPLNALIGFAVIGLPSLLYALLGRFSIRPPPEPGTKWEKWDDEEK